MKRLFFILLSFTVSIILMGSVFSKESRHLKASKKYYNKKAKNKVKRYKKRKRYSYRKRYRNKVKRYKKRKRYSYRKRYRNKVKRYKKRKRYSYRRRNKRRAFRKGRKNNFSLTEEKYIKELIRKTTLNNQMYSQKRKAKDSYSVDYANSVLEKGGLMGNTNFRLANSKKSIFGNSLFVSSSNRLASVSITTAPLQGNTMVLYVKSPYKIKKCFGSIAGKKIRLYNIKNHNIFRGYVGFDIHHYSGYVKLVVGVLLKNGKITFLEKGININKKLNIAKRLPIHRIWKKRYGYKWVVVKYKKRVRRRNRLVWRTFYRKKRIRYRRLIKIKSPILPRAPKANAKALIKQELTSKNNNLGVSKKGIGGEDGYEYDLSKNKDNVSRYGNFLAKENRSFKSYYKKSLPYQLWSGSFLQPIYPGKDGRVSSKFGVYRVYRYRRKTYRGYHRGLDIAVKKGEPIYAPNHGIVVVAKYFKVRGNVIMIDHGLGVMSVHLHLNRINVKKGMFVNKGQLIGTVGSTGRSTGPHLHWEIRVNGVSVDTTQWKNHRFIK